MNLKIQGRTALVTGGANGIGKAIVLGLQMEGVSVAYTCRGTPPDGNGIQTELDDYTPPFYPDILVNNAGSTMDVKDPLSEDWGKVLKLNFEIPVRLSNHCIPMMKSRGWGRIVNIGSCSGLENRGPWPFCSAKAALTAYTRSMGRILAAESPNVVMSAVYPGVVFTEGGHWDGKPEHWERYRKEVPVNRFGKPEEIVPYILLQCSELASFSHGSILGVDGGLSKGYAHSYL